MGRKLNILFCVTNDLNYDQRMQRICSTLHRAGYDVELIGRKKRGSLPVSPRGYTQTRLKLPVEKGKLFYLFYNLRLFFYLMFSSCDAVCAIDLDTLPACAMAAILRRKKLVFDAHEHYTEVPELIGRNVSKAIWNLAAKLFIPRAALAYTVGPKLAELLSQRYHNTFEVVLNVPYKLEHIPGPTKSVQPPVLLYQGALNEGRGLEACIVAMHKTEANLWIAGEGDLSMKLRQLVKTENLENKIKFLGRVLPADLKSITEKCFAGLNLLEPKGESYYYSLANKFFDYIQAGIPCICIDFPEYRKLNDHYSVALLCPAEASEIAAAINRLMENEELYKDLQQHCVEAAKIFNWEEEEKKLLTHYQKLFYDTL